MAGMNTINTLNLTRTNLWSRQIKELLLDELNAMKFVRIISDFPDGQTINIPSIGADVIAAFVPREHRALMEAVEINILSKANSGQTASNTNTINNADHRWVATGTVNSAPAIQFADFARARYALTKANVPLNNLCAIVDPSVAYVLETQTNIVNLLSPAVRWNELPETGLVNGFKFRFNIYGFDVYESNY